MIESLPSLWVTCFVSDLVKFIRGVNYKKEMARSEPHPGFLPIIRANNINGNLNYDDLVYVPDKCVSEEQLLQTDDILFAMSSGSKHLVGKSAHSKKSFKGGFGAFCGLLRPVNNINASFLAFFFQSPAYRHFIAELSSGININNLRQSDILNLDFSLPPLPEQRRIVGKIEELFSDLDAGIAALKKAKEQLKTYRQSVLKWAFEGKLTNDNLKEGELPAGWKWVKIADLLIDLKYGTAKKCGLEKLGQPVLRIPNIGDGAIDQSDLKYADFTKAEIEQYGLLENDILVIRSNGSVSLVGKAALASKKDVGFLYAGYLIRLRLKNDQCLPKFVCIGLSIPRLRMQIEDLARSTSGVNNINSDEIRSLLIPLPALKEQSAIVSEIESRLSVADNLEKTIDASIIQATALRQSVLKRAFEGKLVPQDPNDEPAEKLLERIKAERGKESKRG